MHAAFAHFQVFFQHYGLAAVAVVLLLENFGLPLPGELALLYAGYHSSTQGSFGLPRLIVIAGLACIVGQAIGYLLGRCCSGRVRRLLRLSGARQARIEAYFQHYGPHTILIARFIAGLRVFAGPVAGLYQMPWRPFMAFNALGAVVWVAAVSGTGALLGAHWRRLVQLAGRADFIILLIAVVALWIVWRRLRHGEHHG